MQGDSVLSAAWSPDGREIAASRGDSLFVVPSDGGAQRHVATGQDLHSCVWSPAGARIACVSGNRNYVVPGATFGNIAPSALISIDVKRGVVDSLTDHSAFVASPAWSADGKRLYFVSDRDGPRDVYVMDVLASGRGRGTARITTGLNAQTFVLSADETRLAYSVYTARANLYSVRIPAQGTVSSRSAVALTSGNQIIEAVRVSRDGRSVVFDSNREGAFDVYRMPVDGGAAENITAEAGDEFQPDLSPDGREVAYHSWRTGSRDIFVKPVNGGPAVQVTHTGLHEAGPVWSPDGRSIAFWTIGSRRHIYVVHRDAGGNWGTPVDRGLTTFRPEWLGGGRGIIYGTDFRIAYTAADSGPSRVIYSPANGAAPEATWVQSSPDGHVVYFKSFDADGRASIWSVPVTGGKPRRLVIFDDLTRPSIRPDFAADGRSFYFGIDDRQSDIWVAEIARTTASRAK
jgi:Tol biopolymer transport system component